MIGKILGPLGEGFRDALRLFVAIAVAPFHALFAFVHHADSGKASRIRARVHR